MKPDKPEVAQSTNRDGVTGPALTFVVLLCILACGVMFTLNPISVAVDSVYKGF